MLPVSYVAFKFCGAASYWVFIILLVSEIIEIIIRVWVVLPLIEHRYSTYIREVIFPLFSVMIVSPLLPIVLLRNLRTTDIFHFAIMCFVSLLCSLITIWLLGLKGQERVYVKGLIKKKIV